MKATVSLAPLPLLQNKYKEEGKKSINSCMYSQLPETTEIQFAKTVSEMQSKVGRLK